jgi:ATP-dependent Clp protease ATP-binding subunit ClpB
LVSSKNIKEQLVDLEHQAQLAEKQTDYNKVAEIRYGKIPQLQKELEELEQKVIEARKNGRLTVKDIVEPEDIAQIIAKRTGIPASKLIETDIEKLTQLENHLSQYVIGQPEAVSIVSNAIRRSRA